MSFRRNSENSLAWHKWLQQNEKLLDDCGLPTIVFASESHWRDFLEHGFLDHHNDAINFTVDELSETKLRKLKDFLESSLTSQEKQSALVLLQIDSKLNDFAR